MIFFGHTAGYVVPEETQFEDGSGTQSLPAALQFQIQIFSGLDPH